MNQPTVQLADPRLYSIVWIAAIAVELTAASAMLDEEHKPPANFVKNESDVNKYIWGSIGKHNIVIAFLHAGFSGQNNAATTIACFKSSLPHIKVGVLRDPSLKEVSQHQGAKHDRLFKPDYSHMTGNRGCSGCDPRQEIPRSQRKSTLPEIHQGVILSGNAVIRTAYRRDLIAKTTEQDCLCYETEAAAIVSQLPCLVIRGIGDYADSHKNDVWQSYAAATAAAYAKTLLCNLDARVQVNTIPYKELASQGVETVATAAERDVLSRLPISDEARYDSWEEGESPLCLPDTREDIFKQLFEWLEKDRPSTLWVNGMAGTGKSTISRSFATDLKKRRQLGASFFFKRDDLKRGGAQMFSSTIAADLASHLPAVRASIVDTVKSHDRIAHTNAKKQFQLLVLDPLSKVQLDRNIAIVIDAVDECQDADLKSLFALVSAFQGAKLPRVKLFFTSRPDLPVLKGYNPSTENYATIALHQVKDSTVNHDIRMYLEHRLQEIRESYNRSVSKFSKLATSWPSRKDVEKLLNMSNRLFVVAAIMCRLLEEDSVISPDLQLRGLLELKTTTGDAFESIYKPVLDRQIPKMMKSHDKESLIRECKQVLGAICVLRSPISVPALARLLGLEVGRVEHRLRSLQSVIEVIRPKDSVSNEETQIRLFHRSFRDYFLSEEVGESSPIRVTEKDAHHAMMRGCLATLNKPKTGLRFNICQLKMPGTPRSEVGPEVLARFFTQDLAYACRHLTGHALSARFEITDGDEIHQFLLSHLLHWLEASAYLGTHGNPAREFLRLRSLVSRDKKSTKVLALLRDAYRFAAAHYDSLDEAPLQIYTALIFTPTNSIVRKTFGHKYNAWVQGKPVVDNNWSMAFRSTTVKPLPTRGILKLLFSPNEMILAAMSWDAVWFLTFLGEQLFWIPIDNPLGDGESPVAVVFSSDSKLIALRTGIGEIGIWNIEGGSEDFKKKVQLFKAEYDADYFHRPRSFTHNNDCVLIASYHFADILSIETGTLVRKICFPDAAHEVAVSPDCSTLVGHFDDCLIFWNIESGQQVRRASLPTEKKALSYDLVLSSNETAWTITTESTGGMEVYSTTSDGPVAYLGEEKSAYAISAYYLTIEYEDDIRIWKHGNENPQVIKKTSQRPATTIAYSARQLASSTTDDIAPGVIFFTELPKHQPRIMKDSPCPAESECGDGYLERFVISPNGTMMGSIGPEGARILSARPGLPSFVKQEGLMEMIAFSSTGDYFTTSKGRVLYLWERTGNGRLEHRSHYVVPEKWHIKTASFSSNPCLCQITVAHYDKFMAYLAVLQVPSFEVLGGEVIPSPSVSEAILSPDGRLLAIINKDGLDIQDTSDRTSILKLKKAVSAVQISPDSTLALLIDEENLQLWHIGRKICLHSETRCPFSGAAFDGKECVIHTNTGKIAYHIASGTVQAPYRESGPERASLPDNSGWQSGHSPAATQAEPLTMTLMRVGWGTAKDGHWITWNGQNWILLPTQYWARDSAVDGNCVLIVNNALVEAWYEFNEVPVLEEQSNDVDVEMTDYQECFPKGLGIRQY
ncbi:hypothetical protein MY10362_005206 [Beauveria mimosiformis]